MAKKHIIQSADGIKHIIEAPDDATPDQIVAFAEQHFSGGAAQPQPQPQGWLDWGKELVQGKQDPRFKDIKTVYSLDPSIRGKVNAAEVFGASDAQRADVMRNALGDRFVGLEKDANDYDVLSFKDAQGNVQRGYVNAPGLDAEDVARGIKGALPYAASGGVAGLAGRGLGLMGNAFLQGGAATGTSIGGDVAQMPLGSEQGIEGGKAALAGGFGAAGPVVARGISNAREVIANRFGQVPNPLQGFDRTAVQNVGRAMDADNIDNLAYQQQAANLGNEGMIADMGPTSRITTARIARNPGEGRQIVTRALDRRADGAQARIDADVAGALGPRQNVPQAVRQQSQTYNRLAKPHYDAFHNSHIPITRPLRSILGRVPNAAVNKARELMRREGIKPRNLIRFENDPMSPLTGVKSQTSTRVPNGVELDYIKRGIDDLAREAAPGSNEQRILGNLARDLRNTVDEILSPGDPTQSPWFQARAISGQGLEGNEAVDLGSKVFSQKRDPHQVADELGDLSLYGQDMYRMGARNDLRQIAGRAGSNFGSTGDAAMRRALNNDFNRENLTQITQSPIAADRLVRRVEAENVFAETNDMAQRNSITPTMQAAENLVPTPRGSDFAKDAGKKGPLGHAYELGLRAADWMLGGRLDRRAELVARDMARIFTTQGMDRDLIADAFFRLRQMRGVNRDRAAALERALNVARTAGQGPAANTLSSE